ncbi:MAG: lactonase family protein [Endozoicomonas sp.]|uniref:lactonase family protein n=1 Tax=Endozoicomonas sp. TaxID=1892382 RepID=UPI003D9B6C30
MKANKLSALIAPAFFLVVSHQASAFYYSGNVYAMNNNQTDNEVIVYERKSDGKLALIDKVSTGGLGGVNAEGALDDALGSQNPLVLSRNGRCLFAVNAGDDTVTSFIIHRKKFSEHSIKRVGKVSSGGAFPVSIANNRDLLYVLNSGGEGNISGFSVSRSCQLSKLEGSERTLNAAGLNPPSFIDSPAQVSFVPGGRGLLVTIKSSDQLLYFPLDENELPAQESSVTQSNGRVPFGFSFFKNNLLVAEAFGNATSIPSPNAGAVSSYAILPDGELKLQSASVENGQTATCWMASSRFIPYSYATNNLSDSITGYKVDSRTGVLSLLDSDGITAETDESPVDLAITYDARYLYNVNATAGTVTGYAIDRKNGSLRSVGSFGGLEEGAVGIAVW